MKSHATPHALLQQAAQIQRMERGKLSVIRQGPAGPYHNHQFRQDGKYVTRYVPKPQVSATQEAIDGYQQFHQLVEQYVEQVVQKTRAEIADDSKKNKSRRRPS